MCPPLTSFILTFLFFGQFLFEQVIFGSASQILCVFLYLSVLFANVRFLIKCVLVPQVEGNVLNKCVTISVDLAPQNIKLVGDNMGDDTKL